MTEWPFSDLCGHLNCYHVNTGYLVVEAPHYKPEGPMGPLGFFIHLVLHHGPRVNSASNRNEYQG